MSDANLTFLPWLRLGLAAGITQEDNGITPLGSEHASVQLKIVIHEKSPDVPIATLAMLGPGEIVGINQGTVVRTWPKPNDSEAEFGYFPLIEFDQADLLCRYTPARATTGTNPDHLRPWFCLVILEDGEVVSLAAPASDKRLPVLVAQEGRLPNLTESWAWAHTQCSGDAPPPPVGGDSPDWRRVLGQEPQRFVSRLICPRILHENTGYQAFLVPAFERGRLAGLGDTVAGDALAPAWSGNGTPGLRLPVYYQWRFRTGTVRSFKDLVKLLTPRPLPNTVGIREMDVMDPGMDLPRAAIGPLGLEGALKAVTTMSTPWPDPVKRDWVSSLKPLLDSPEDAITVGAPLQRVAPPLYGRWHAKAKRVPAEENGTPRWFRELNIDPRTRVAAGLGTLVVQDEQQELMASAWRQVEKIRQINQELRVLQIGRAASARAFTRHVASAPLEQSLLVTSQVHGRIVAPPSLLIQPTGTRTVFALFEDSPIAGGVLSAPWRRFSSSLGALGKRQGRDPAVASNILDRMNTGAFRPAGEPPLPEGMATPQAVGSSVVPPSVSPENVNECAHLGPADRLFWGLVMVWVARSRMAQGTLLWARSPLMRLGLFLLRTAKDVTVYDRSAGLGAGTFSATDIANAPAVPSGEPDEPPPNDGGPAIPIPPPGAVDSPKWAAFRAAAVRLFNDLRTPPHPGPTLVSVDLPAVNRAILTAIDPDVTIAASIWTRVTRTGDLAGWDPPNRLETILAAPDFPKAMSEPLQKLSQDWILPGLDRVPPNTVAIAVTNQRFVEAYMVGLNHEMARELLWNEYPTDQRGTYFRQFWATAGFVPRVGEDVVPENLKDIKAIHTWPAASTLGQNSSRLPMSTGHLVLLVRGQLVQAFPGVIVYAQKAMGLTAPRQLLPDSDIHPVFQGRLEPDVAFYGFELNLADARGDATHPGWFFVLQEQLAEPRFGPWPKPEPEPGEPAKFFAPPRDGATSATVAGDALHQATRVAIHGSDLLPEAP